jgi:hypothetical protein
MIFEATEPGFPADQAVRIFVQFDRVEAATKVGQAGWMGGWARVGGACWGRAAGVCKPLCIRASSVEPRLPHVSEPLVLSLASPLPAATPAPACALPRRRWWTCRGGSLGGVRCLPASLRRRGSSAASWRPAPRRSGASCCPAGVQAECHPAHRWLAAAGHASAWLSALAHLARRPLAVP